ncbi:MAG: hypothetical protein KF709_01205 [Gemmatimonadaceae bacterium]|nr:hypothetical protein [Gemmatimonadaceae bacterium]
MTPEHLGEGSSVSARVSGGNPSLVSLLALVIERWRLVAGTVAAAVALALVLRVVLPARFTSEARFTARSAESGSASQLSALAGQFGIAVPGATGAPPAFYADLLLSREVLLPVLRDTFEVASGSDAQRGPGSTLLELSGVSGDTPELLVDEGLKWMAERVLRARVFRETGVIAVTATTAVPDLSAQVLAAVLESLNRFNLESRQQSAADERAFVESRVADSETQLRRAEQALAEFLESNRVIANSPELQAERDRLQREVSMRQVLYTNLHTAWDQARLAEIRDTPVLTIVERPSTPVRPDGLPLVLLVALSATVGGVVGSFLVLAGAFFSGLLEDSPAERQRLKAALESLRRRAP